MKTGSLELRTKRLVIRPMRAGDFEVWRAAHLECPASRNTWDTAARPASELTRAKFAKNLRGMVKRQADDRFYVFGIYLRAGGVQIGSMSIMNLHRGISQTAEVGYSLFNPYWGQGYASEALRGIFTIAFKRIGLHRVEAGIEPRNRRSIRLARAVGMRKEGLKRRILFLRGKWRDHLMFAITCEDLGWKYRGKKPTFHPG